MILTSFFFLAIVCYVSVFSFFYLYTNDWLLLTVHNYVFHFLPIQIKNLEKCYNIEIKKILHYFKGQNVFHRIIYREDFLLTFT